MSEVEVKIKDLPMRGVRPLPLHIALALSDISKGFLEDNPLFIEGIQKYINHAFRRQNPELSTIWESDGIKVLYKPSELEKIKHSIFLIPSLVNGAEILDLLPDNSFINWLSGEGYDVYLCDWGDISKNSPDLSMEGLITEKLIPAIECVKSRSGNHLHGLGYCMGGTLLAASAVIKEDAFDRLIFLASPWDFFGGDRILQKHICASSPYAMDMISAKGHLPMEWIQSAFVAVNGSRAKDKFIKFAKMDQDSEQAHLFVAVEDWLNEGRALAKDIAFQCVQQWYGSNVTANGRWIVAGNLINISKITCPTLIIASENDHLVPYASSIALAEEINGAEILSIKSGHIGMITGKNALKDMWLPLHEWISGKS